MAVAKITQKGQLTIPADYRRRLGTDIVEVEMEGNRVIIKPLKKLGGIFSKFAIKGESADEIIKREEKIARDAFTKNKSGS